MKSTMDGMVLGVSLFIGLVALVEFLYPGLTLSTIKFVFFPTTFS